jgi:hypothetical protein
MQVSAENKEKIQNTIDTVNHAFITIRKDLVQNPKFSQKTKEQQENEIFSNIINLVTLLHNQLICYGGAFLDILATDVEGPHFLARIDVNLEHQGKAAFSIKEGDELLDSDDTLTIPRATRKPGLSGEKAQVVQKDPIQEIAWAIAKNFETFRGFSVNTDSDPSTTVFKNSPTE